MSNFKWNEKIDVTEAEEKAIRKALSYAGHEENIEDDLLQDWIDCNYVTKNLCRNKRDAIWVMTDKTHEAAVYIDTLDLLDKNEIESQLM